MNFVENRKRKARQFVNAEILTLSRLVAQKYHKPGTQVEIIRSIESAKSVSRCFLGRRSKARRTSKIRSSLVSLPKIY